MCGKSHDRRRPRDTELWEITDVLGREYSGAVSRHTVGERVKDIRDRFNDLRKAMLSRDLASLPLLPDPEAFGKDPEESWELPEHIPDAFVLQVSPPVLHAVLQPGPQCVFAAPYPQPYPQHPSSISKGRADTTKKGGK